MLPGDAREAQGVLTMGAFAEDMRFSVAHFQISAAHRHKELAEEAAKGGVFPLTLAKVTGEKAKEGIAEGDEIQKGKDNAEHAMGVENSA